MTVTKRNNRWVVKLNGVYHIFSGKYPRQLVCLMALANEWR